MAASVPLPPDKDRDIKDYVEERGEHLVRGLADSKILRDLADKVESGNFHLGAILDLFHPDEIRKIDPELSGALAEEKILDEAIKMLSHHSTGATGATAGLLGRLHTVFTEQKQHFVDLHTKGTTVDIKSGTVDTLLKEVFSDPTGVDAARKLLAEAKTLQNTHRITIDTEELVKAVEEIVRVTKEKPLAKKSFGTFDAATQAEIERQTKKVKEDTENLDKKVKEKEDSLRVDIKRLQKREQDENRAHTEKIEDINSGHIESMQDLDRTTESHKKRNQKKHEQEKTVANSELTQKKRSVAEQIQSKRIAQVNVNDNKRIQLDAEIQKLNTERDDAEKVCQTALEKIQEKDDEENEKIEQDYKKEKTRLSKKLDKDLKIENDRHTESVEKTQNDIAAKEKELSTVAETFQDRLRKAEKKLNDLKADKSKVQTNTVYESMVPYSQLKALQAVLTREYNAAKGEKDQAEKRIDALKKRETREAPAATKFSTIDVSQYEKLDDIKTYDELIQDAYRTVLEGNSMPLGANQMRDAYLRLAKENKIPTTLNSSPISGYLAMVAECERLEQALAQQGKSSEYARKFLDDIRNNEKHPFVVLKKLIEKRKAVRDAELEVARLAGSGNPVEVDMANQKLANEKRALRDFEVKMLGRSKANAVYTYLKKNAAKLNTTNYEIKNRELNQKITEINGEIARLQGILSGEESKTERARLEERIMFLKRTLAKLEQIALQRRTRQEAVEAHNDEQKLPTNIDKIYKALQTEFNSRFIEKGTALGFVKGNFQNARMRMGGVWEVNFFGKMIKMPFFGNKLRRMAELIAEKNASTNLLLAQYRKTELKRSPWRRAESAWVQWAERNFLRSQQKKIESMQASIDRSAERLLALEKKKMDKYEKYKEKHGQSAYIEERISLREREHQAAQAELKEFTDPKYLKEPKDDAEIALRAQQREAAEETMYKEFMEDLSKAGITEAMYPKERFTDPAERKEALKLYFGRLAVSRYPEGLKRLKVFTDFLKTKRPDIAYQFSAKHFVKIMKTEEDANKADGKDFRTAERCEQLWKEKETTFVAAHPDRIFTPAEFFNKL